MKSVVRLLLFIFLAVIVFLGAVTMTFLIRGGAFYETQAIAPGSCKNIALTDGSAEDIQTDRLSKTAYLSVLDRRAIGGGKRLTGTILSLDLNAETPVPQPALTSQPDDFHPHGLSLFTNDSGQTSLFVLNHAQDGEKVELFIKQNDDTAFEHIRTYSSPLLIEPNDIVAITESSFYVANDSGASNPLERAAEMLLAIGLSPLVYFDGTTFSTPADDLKSAGGINVNQERTKLFVGETLGKSIKVYDLNADGALYGDPKTIALKGGVDNIDIDENGVLWIANHTNTLSLIKHFTDAASPAPTQIQTITFDAEDEADITTVYEEDGTTFSAGSVANKVEDRILMGSITEKRVRICQMQGE
ncbi:MAG: SMP-30/gluconolactonase/LRE family protein [Rhodospirillaceae bacterium]